MESLWRTAKNLAVCIFSKESLEKHKRNSRRYQYERPWHFTRIVFSAAWLVPWTCFALGTCLSSIAVTHTVRESFCKAFSPGLNPILMAQHVGIWTFGNLQQPKYITRRFTICTLRILRSVFLKYAMLRQGCVNKSQRYMR